jgi:phosphoribosyl-AMP cyclohydrolase
MFKKREKIKEIEEGKYLSPKFNKEDLIPVITMDAKSKEILMHGYMNDEALKKTIETKEVHYWSRSRKKIWHKGEISGFKQKVVEMKIDDDQDAIWLTVDIGNGISCHVGYRSCFYRNIPLGQIKDLGQIEMDFKERKKVFDPEKIYKDKPNPTEI